MGSNKVDGLNPLTIGIYGTGHVLNDLAAACWFNYLLYFMSEVLDVGGAQAGGIMLAGQITDGIVTPIVGLFSDKFTTRIGKRKPWYIGGTAIVAVSFGFIWQNCLICIGNNSEGLKVFWYALFASLFNIGWACVQISHMSMIPQLSPDKNRRNILIGLRTAFTYISNVIVLALAFILFNTVSVPRTQFIILSLIVLAVGVTLNILFIVGIREVHLTNITEQKNVDLLEEKGGMESVHERLLEHTQKSQAMRLSHEPEKPHKIGFQNGRNSAPINATNDEDEEEEEIPEWLQTSEETIQDLATNFIQSNEERQITWREWLSYRGFWPVGANYMLARLGNNSSMSLMPFYLTIVLEAGGVTNPDQLTKKTPWQLAVIPLLEYIASVGASFLLERLGMRFTRQVMVLGGAVFVALGSFPMFFLTPETIWLMFPIAILIGIGFSLQLNNAMGFIADFIGPYGKSGAFVYGAISLCDKFGTGVALFAIMSGGDINDTVYLQVMVPGVPLISCTAAFLVTLLMRKSFLRKTVQSSELAAEELPKEEN